MEKFDPGPIKAYIARHEISLVAFAAMARVPLATLNPIIHYGAQPRAGTREKIAAALSMDPPAPKRRHEEIVRELWSYADRSNIAAALGVTPQRVSAIAKRAGLPPLTRRNEDHGKRPGTPAEGRDRDAAAE